MQSLKLQSLAWRSRPSLRFLPHHRRLSASVAAATAIQDDNLQNQVLVEGKASARAAILNRPNSLNALTSNMGIRLKKLYESWEDNADIGFVMMKGSGRAFSAGGDVISLYHLINQGKFEECKDLFRNIYSFIYTLGTYLKPHVAVLDGITMGGGGGISVPGTFRIATDKTVFSTPEIHIGFHPDAAASFYLSHLTGYVGEYLALTGEKINGVDMLALGLATHYSMSARLSWIDERLAKLVTDDPSVLDSSLAQYGDVVYPDKQSIVHRLEAIDRCFSRETVEEIIDALEEEAARSNQDWCHRALKKLKEASPLSLKVSLRSIREGRYQTLDECLIREYRMSLHVISKEVSPDFCEGIRARLVEKDIEPKWDPPTLKHVSDDMVDHYFSPLGEFEPELKLPTHLREAFI
ncbi:3-hydroxyisobutyryl-CoA hydrolase-like protein 2, mitochondrial [Asparagus officinalis]|uniref:3-hydroxyisobutyryl-CoA hydrolase-like protein 2, mitochondrial n=1 Tax=Asparagus officinalis TaxID=4686 RepID=UPI00098E18E5|nr:3-hydroxyisobutyryl-CoA hydrolase-like protein 2, mitochondrial [Asparagus officinalis]